MSRGETITLEASKVQAMLKSDQQVFTVTDAKGTWTGVAINKAHIVSTSRDYDAEREWNRDNGPKRIAERSAVMTPEQKRRIEKTKREISEKFKIKK